MVFYFCFVIVVGVFSLKSFNCRGGGGASKLSHDFRAAEESKRKKAWCNCFSFFGRSCVSLLSGIETNFSIAGAHVMSLAFLLYLQLGNITSTR